MGFMDRAKQLADQAQQKLDEKQNEGNERQRTSHAPPGATVPRAAPPPAAGAAMGTSAEDAERIAPPPVTSGDPLKRP